MPKYFVCLNMGIEWTEKGGLLVSITNWAVILYALLMPEGLMVTGSSHAKAFHPTPCKTVWAGAGLWCDIFQLGACQCTFGLCWSEDAGHKKGRAPVLSVICSGYLISCCDRCMGGAAGRDIGRAGEGQGSIPTDETDSLQSELLLPCQTVVPQFPAWASKG